MSDSTSDKYRLMVYFAVGTLHFYRQDIVPIGEGESFGSFAEKNRDVIRRVCDESLSLFNYELSHNQIGMAVKAYLTQSASIHTSPVAQRN